MLDISAELDRQMTAQWLSQPRDTTQHAKAANKDQLARGLRELQKVGRLGMTADQEQYYLRTELEARAAQAYQEWRAWVQEIGQMGSGVALSMLQEFLSRHGVQLSDGGTWSSALPAQLTSLDLPAVDNFLRDVTVRAMPTLKQLSSVA